MRVYAATLWLASDRGAEPALATIADWLRNGKEEAVTTKDLRVPGQRALPSGATLDVVNTDTGSPYLHAIQYRHRDKTEHGRFWVAEFGIRAETSAPEMECSIYLYTDEASTRVSTAVSATRPMVVRKLLNRCAPTPRTNGVNRLSLSVDSTTAITRFARSTSRDGPMVVVSPTPDGSHPVDLDRLQDLVAGLGTVVVIPSKEDTRAIAAIFGDGYTPYGGAITMLFPVRQGPYSAPIPMRRLLPADIAALKDAGKPVEMEIFSMLTDRMNVANSRRHISPEFVRRERSRRSIARHAREGASATELREWTGALELEISALEETVASRNRDVDSLELDILRLSDELDDLRRERHESRTTASALEAQLSRVRTSRGASEEEATILRTALEHALDDNPTPEECLLVIEALFPARVVVLESAFKSARESASFRSGKDVLALLRTLAGPYWSALAAGGRGDSQARKLFPSARYAPSETETLSAAGRARRTFLYKGAPLVMLPHLKAGNVKGSASTTLRIHFEWHAEDRVIVIGHCGPHLDFD